MLSHLGYPHAAGTPALRELSAGKSQIGNLRSPGKQQDQASKGLRRKEAALALLAYLFCTETGEDKQVLVLFITPSNPSRSVGRKMDSTNRPINLPHIPTSV